ncbi:acyl-CoA thioesterase [Gemmatimonas phototrophica]|uniref:4-hydroxybenzoyl-CoA thioesterase n=1 Tax=Gemmatimonas phototrophica TaxID=1379270 RepID=A0A143BLR6_9BACT|nr:thioesterase family protein [Gemmatimonas phototrophica]AMW05987.1 4-hydroxybenzoyl-CoA thioesterase [Gemmatimonas phototrophica]
MTVLTLAETSPARPRFAKQMRVPFSACDPAGIVFFAQYYVMFQNLVDDWVTEGLGIAYGDLLGPRRVGLPTVRFETDFRAISTMGDLITLGLEVEQLGNKSLTLQLMVHGPNGVRVEARQVIVCTNLDTHRSMAFPTDLRDAIETFMATPTESA